MQLKEFTCLKRKYWTGAVVANHVIQTKNKNDGSATHSRTNVPKTKDKKQKNIGNVDFSWNIVRKLVMRSRQLVQFFFKKGAGCQY